MMDNNNSDDVDDNTCVIKNAANKNKKKRGFLPLVEQSFEQSSAAAKKLKDADNIHKFQTNYPAKGTSSNSKFPDIDDFLMNMESGGGDDDYSGTVEEELPNKHTNCFDAEDLHKTDAYGYDENDDQGLQEDIGEDDDAVDNFDFNDLLENKSLEHFKHIFRRSGLRSYPSDSDLPANPLVDNADNPDGLKTKQMLAMKLSEIQASASLSDKTMLLFLQLWNDYCPGMNLPISQIGNNGNFKSDIDKYTEADDRKFKVHCCPMGCTAYLGTHAQELFCVNIKCKMARFRPCTHHSHGDDAESARVCDPFNGGHSIRGRRPYRSFFYRPMLPLFQSMDRWSRENNNGVYDTFDATRDRDGNINDVLDGHNPRKNLDEMHARFQERKLLNPNLKEVSHVMSQFYDGGTLFDRKSKSIWPLVISILNCNPADRMNYGIGLFMIILHDLPIGSVAEEAIFNQLLIPELHLLRDGVEYSYIDLNGDKVDVFLQARLVLHIMDTIALTKKAKLYGKFCIRFEVPCNCF
jgi:hypothetical protein